MIYVFGAFLIYTGIRMAFHRDAEVHPERNPVLRQVRRLVPMTSDFEGEGFFVRRAGKLLATPLFAVIIVMMTTDVVFAVDSIPAIFAITSSAFIVWTANAFACSASGCSTSCSPA
jgi:tellurite resistance protein TerC